MFSKKRFRTRTVVSNAGGLTDLIAGSSIQTRIVPAAAIFACDFTNTGGDAVMLLLKKKSRPRVHVSKFNGKNVKETKLKTCDLLYHQARKERKPVKITDITWEKKERKHLNENENPIILGCCFSDRTRSCTFFIIDSCEDHHPITSLIIKNYNILDCDWFKKLLFFTNSVAQLLSDSSLLESLLSDSSKSQSHSMWYSSNQPI